MIVYNIKYYNNIFGINENMLICAENIKDAKDSFTEMHPRFKLLEIKRDIFQ